MVAVVEYRAISRNGAMIDRILLTIANDDERGGKIDPPAPVAEWQTLRT